jgi:hypothetical protein
MSISPRITNKVIEGLRVQLKEAADVTPAPQWMSQMDVIRELEDEISSLQAKGFPLKANRDFRKTWCPDDARQAEYLPEPRASGKIQNSMTRP